MPHPDPATRPAFTFLEELTSQVNIPVSGSYDRTLLAYSAVISILLIPLNGEALLFQQRGLLNPVGVPAFNVAGVIIIFTRP